MDLQTKMMVSRIESFYDDLDRAIDGCETDDDLDLDLMAPVLDQMRDLVKAGVMKLPLESQRALFTIYAPITARRVSHGT